MYTEAERKRFDESLMSIITQFNSYEGEDVDTSSITRAFEYACAAHEGQRRYTGEPFFIHPIEVALILTEIEVDQVTIIGALLHDTVEDTDVSLEDLEKEFGKDVAEIVDGVTKLEKMTFSSKKELQAENYRKMFLAMAKDIRVVLIKLADRLHNMRTLKYMRADKQIQKANETLDIYAPLAHRLGIYKWKWELEDLCLRHIDKEVYYQLVGSISQKREDREDYLQQVLMDLQVNIKNMGIYAELEGRPKHFYSIYKKMKTKQLVLDEIYDLFACRIIVNTVADCYAVLGLVHEKYRPMPGRFKDYIAMPKPNMYQSLHTTVFGPKGIPFEVQIRTFAMHRTAEFGIAAHYRYKENNTAPPTKADDAFDEKLSWLRQLLDWQRDMKDADEYMDALKTGLIEDEVFVFTPKGEVINLPLGATPIDFAYSIHSGIGNRMYGAKVNGRITPLTYELQNGDILEILTSDKVNGPSRDWLKIVKSSSARSKINQWFKKEMREENIHRGKEIVEREIKKSGFTHTQLMKQEFLDIVLKKFNYNSMDDLYAVVGYGDFSPQKIVPRLKDEYIKSLSESERNKIGYRINSSGQVVQSKNMPVLEDDEVVIVKPLQKKSTKSDSGVIVKGLDNCLVRFPQCCSPVPGDSIIGYISRGKGVTVHRKDCVNIRSLLMGAQLNEQDSERVSRLIECHWANDELEGTYEVKLKILAHDRRYLFSEISNAIAEEKVPIIGGKLEAVKDVRATCYLTIEIKNHNQYDRVLGRIKAIRDVYDVVRL